MRRLVDNAVPQVIVAPVHALMQVVPCAESLDAMMRVLRVGLRHSIDELAAWLSGSGFTRVETIETPGEFAVRGGIAAWSGEAGPGTSVD